MVQEGPPSLPPLYAANQMKDRKLFMSAHNPLVRTQLPGPTNCKEYMGYKISLGGHVAS